MVWPHSNMPKAVRRSIPLSSWRICRKLKSNTEDAPFLQITSPPEMFGDNKLYLNADYVNILQQMDVYSSCRWSNRPPCSNGIHKFTHPVTHFVLPTWKWIERLLIFCNVFDNLRTCFHSSTSNQSMSGSLCTFPFKNAPFRGQSSPPTCFSWLFPSWGFLLQNIPSRPYRLNYIQNMMQISPEQCPGCCNL